MLPVSVVIPAVNREQLLKRALMSVAAQRPCAPTEVIVVDDGSTDATARVAAEMGARVITHASNRGEGAARNSGIHAATQPWIALLDSDDEWLPHHLATIWERRGGHVLVAASALRCGAAPEDDRVHGASGRRPRFLTSPAQLVFPENPVPVSGGMLRRDIAERIGGYAEGLPQCADLDFLLRYLEQGTAVVLPTVTVIYHLHADQASGQREAMKAAQTQVVRSYAGRSWWSQRQLDRWQAVVAWDRYRLPGGTGHALDFALMLTQRPSWMAALIRLWVGRLRGRRRGSALSRDGSPSLALLSTASEQEPGGRRVVDLRSVPRRHAIFRLARRPTGAAVVGTTIEALLVRALGIRPLRQPKA